MSKQGEKRIALSFSEYESLDTIIKNKDKIEWVWVDCFTTFPLTKSIEQQLHSFGLKICIVSPELQIHGNDIVKYKEYIKKSNIKIDAICTKEFNVKLWI